MPQLNLSKQSTEWIERAIFVNSEEYERIMVSLSDDKEREQSAELDNLQKWLDELRQELEQRKIIESVLKSRAAIVAYCDAEKRPRGTSGTIPCPICETGTLHFSRAAYNGHIHAKCTTEKCVQWIE